MIRRIHTLQLAMRKLLTEGHSRSAGVPREIEGLDSASSALGAHIVKDARLDRRVKARLLANGTVSGDETGITTYDDTQL